MPFSPPHSCVLALSPLMFWRNRLLLLLLGVSLCTSALWTDQATSVQAQDAPQPLRRNTDPAATQPVIWVNPQTGNDARADGSEQNPFRTLTRALEQAQSNMVIQLAPGTYSTDTGEVFPIMVKANVTVQGNPDELGQGVVIRGGGSYTSTALDRQNVTLILSRQSTLAGVTVTNPTVRGHGVWVETGNPTLRDSTLINSTQSGLVVAGSSTPEVQNNLFVLNRVSGLTVTNSARPTIANNVFQRTGSGLMVSKDAAPRIVSNRISQNRDGIVIQDNARPVMRSNTVEDSVRNGLVVIAQAQPDLGTPQDPGNNVFLHNQQHDIDALATSQVLPAFGNQFADSRLSGNVDLTGTVPLVGITTVASVSHQLPVSPPSAPTATSRSTQTRSAALPQPTQQQAVQPSASSGSLISSAPSRVISPASTLISSLPPSSRTPQTEAANTANRSASTPQVVAARPTPSSQTRSAVQLTALTSPRPADAPPDHSTAAVEINVPPPDATGAPSAAAALLTAPRSTAQSIPTAPASASAIEIPVPAPETAVPTLAMATAAPQMASVTVAAAPSLPRQTLPVTNAVPQLGGSPISIPVPPPETSRTAPPSSTVVAAANADTRILRVPGSDIPLGNTGDLSRINVANAISPAALAANRASLQYRVVVEAEDVEMQEFVKSIVPGSFATLINDQMVVQVGAFSNPDNAAEVMEKLSQNGLQGIIQPME